MPGSVVRGLLAAPPLLLLSGCLSLSNADHRNICAMLGKNPGWKIALSTAERKWQADPPLVMAFVHQESRFNANASPDKSLSRKTARKNEGAYGYAQAKLSTWDMYRADSDQPGAKRSNFQDAVNFIGWYNWQSHIELGLRLKDATELYYAYHEGRGGYERGSYKAEDKAWLRKVAGKVEKQYRTYRRQYRGGCKSSLKHERRVAPNK